MSYCTLTNVQALNPTRTYGAATTPTTTQVGTFITQVAGEIDTVLQGRGLTTPLTTPAEFVTFLTQLNAVGAAALAERAMFPEAQGLMGTTSAGSAHWKQYQEGLKYLKEGALPSDAAADPAAFSFFEKNQGNDTEPTEEHSWQNPKFGINKEF